MAVRGINDAGGEESTRQSAQQVPELEGVRCMEDVADMGRGEAEAAALAFCFVVLTFFIFIGVVAATRRPSALDDVDVPPTMSFRN